MQIASIKRQISRLFPTFLISRVHMDQITIIPNITLHFPF